MALNIRAMRNNLGTSRSPYYALASWPGVVDTEAFIDQMAAARTTISKTDIVAVFQLAREQLGRLLAQGFYVKTPFGAALPLAKGTFLSPDEPFLPKSPGSDHELRIDFRIDPTLEAEALASIRCHRDKEADRRGPRVLEAVGLPSGNREEIQPGGLIKVIGKRMKFDPADTRLGLFFKDGAGVETRAESSFIVQPSSIITLVPESQKEGNYRLVVRTISKGGELLEGTFWGPLRCVPSRSPPALQPDPPA